jgi:DNA-binding LytR/AlgR family response regulator
MLPPRKLVGKKGQDLCILDLDRVCAIQAEGDTVWIYLSDERYKAAESLNRIEARLSGARFIRVHRNALVNLAHIRKVTGLSSQRYLVTLGNLKEFVVSRRKSGEIRRLIKS